MDHDPLDEPLSTFDYFSVIIQQLNRRMRELCERTGSIFLAELFEVVRDGQRPFTLRDELTMDGCHFNHEGYRVLGQTMCELLQGSIREGALVLMMGDSITAGYPLYEPVLEGPEHGDETHSFGHYLRTRLNCKVINQGISGDHTSSMVGRLEEALDLGPDWVILQGGANDAFVSLALGGYGLNRRRARTQTREIIENYQGMVGLCRAVKAPVAIIPLLPFDVDMA